MEDDLFEWHEAKASGNLAQHKVSFAEAKAVFFDPKAVEVLDDRFPYGEERWIRIGEASGRLLTVTYTDRRDKHRLISARNSTPIEKNEYIKENS